MHTGQIMTLSDAVAFFDRGGHSAGYVGTKEIRALDLTPQQRADLVAFLEALNGPGADAPYRSPSR
jgi:cytochrome c peroxidase